MPKAENDHTTPTNLARRGLFAGVGLLAAGAAVARPLTAKPDAALIALCADFCASEAAYCAIYDGDDCALDDEACAVLGAPIMETWDDMLDRMAVFRAATHEGLAARALALAQHSGMKPGTSNYPFAFDPDDETIPGRLLHYLLRDAVALAGRA